MLGDGNVAFIVDVLGIAQKHLGTGTQEEASNISNKYSEFVYNESDSREFVLVSLGATAKHAIPLSMVNRMEEIKTSMIEVSGFQRVFRYRGGILRIINLNEVLGYPNEKKDRDITQVIVAKVDGQIIGIEVDQIIDVLSTRDFLDQSLSTHEAIMGNLVTDSEIIVVVDVEKVFEMTQTKRSIVSVNESSKKVLLVEDTDSIRNMVARHLKESGYAVEMAVDGMDALRKIAEHKCAFDVIVSDIEMPVMNGYEFARKVRSIGQLKQIPMVAFTTKNNQVDLQEAKLAGFTTFLEKSKGRLLPLLISECLNGNRRKTA